MSYKVLYRKYRPDSFDSLVGQDYTVKMLKNAIITGKNAHAYIFTGPRGTGKTSSAKIFAKALNCLHPIDGNPCNECESCLNFKESPDIIEIDAASNNGVEEIRELINNVKLVPSNSKYKVYIIDEVHMLSTSAFNALLLTLEEPPEHVIFILATTDIQNVPITILSRCQRFDFKPISMDCLISRLSYVCEEEHINITEDAIREISIISAGGLRDALGMLDQLSSDNDEITLESVSNYFGSVSPQVIDELLTCIENNDLDNFTNIMGNIKNSGTNYSVFIDKLIIELRKVAIQIKSGNSKHDFYFDDIYNMIFDLNECLCNININVDPYILIEIVLLKYLNRENNVNFLSGESNLSTDKNISSKEIYNKNSSKMTEKVKKVINFDKNIRVCNCLAEASKQNKIDASNSWKDFIKYAFNNNKSIASLIMDTIVQAASLKYLIISNKIDNTNEAINMDINKIEDLYYKFCENNIHIVSLSVKEWEMEAKKYSEVIRSGGKYEFKEEVITDLNENNDIINDEEDIEKVASDIFGTVDVQ